MVVPIDELFPVGRVGRLSAGRNFGLTTPADVDRVDGGAPDGVAVHHVGYFLAVGRVGRSGFVRVVVGQLEFPTPTGVDCVDLGVVSIESHVGDPLAPGRVRRAVVVRLFAGGVVLIPAATVDGADLVVVTVVSQIGAPTALARTGSF